MTRDLNLVSTFAHLDGSTFVCFSNDGEKLVTGGTDSLVKIFENHNLTEPLFSIDVQLEPITALLCDEKYIYSSSEDLKCSKFDLKTGDLIDVLTREALPIKQIVKCNKSNKLATISDLLGMKIIKCEEKIEVEEILTICSGKRIIGIKFCPILENTIAAVNSDGELVMYDIEKKKLIDSINLGYKFNNNDIQCLEFEFSRNGDHLYVPVNKDIVVLKTNPLKILRAVEIIKTKNSEITTCIKVGTYEEVEFVVATAANSIAIFNSKDFNIIVNQRFEENLTSLALSPLKDQLAFTTDKGKLFVWNDFISHNLSDSTNSKLALTNDTNSNHQYVSELEEEEKASAHSINLFNNKTGSNFSNYHKHLVRPGSMEDYCGKKRFLVYNKFGHIMTTMDEQNSIINVNFHDKEKFKDYSFNDYVNYDMAYINENGALFCKSNSGQNKSILYFRPNSSWHSKNNEWRIESDKDEFFELITMSKDLIVISTSLNYIRVFTLNGIQYDMFLSPVSHTICIVSDGSWRLVLCGLYSSNSCNIAYTVYDLKLMEVLSPTRNVSLSIEAELMWVSIIDTNKLVFYDSNGCLLINGDYIKKTIFRPVLEFSKEDNYILPITIRDSKLYYINIETNDYWILKTQLLDSVDIDPPYLISTANSKIVNLEKKLLLKRTFESENEVENDKVILELIMNLCKEDILTKALDMVSKLKLLNSKKKCVDIALFYKHTRLAEKIEAIINHDSEELNSEHSDSDEQTSNTSSDQEQSSSAVDNLEKESLVKDDINHDESFHSEESLKLKKQRTDNNNNRQQNTILFNPFAKKNMPLNQEHDQISENENNRTGF